MQRQSKQRDEILNILSIKNYHPTVEDIYRELKKRLPKAGIATVYRNLDQLVKADMVTKIDVPGEPARYDGNVEKHYHILCTKCGKIEDVWIDIELAEYVDFQSTIPDYEITDYHIDFWGICKKCSK